MRNLTDIVSKAIRELCRTRAAGGSKREKEGFSEQSGDPHLAAQTGLWLRVDVSALLDLLGLDVNDLLGGLGGGSGTGGINVGSMIKPLLSNLTCGFSPMNVQFTTGSNSLSSGSPFLDGPAGHGAITTEWSQLGPFRGRTTILGLIDPCQLLLDFLPGLIEGGAGGALPDGVDPGGLDLAALLANLDSLNPGPGSITLTRTLDSPVPPIARNPRLALTVNPKQRRVRVGSRVIYRVSVKNIGGGGSLNSRICLTGFAFRQRCKGLGKIAAGKTKVRVFRTRAQLPRLASRHQQILRPRFTASAKNAKRVRTRAPHIRTVRR